MSQLARKASDELVAPPAAIGAQKRRAFWLKHLHQWHWVSAAACLISLVLFSITGVTLNHAKLIEAKPTVVTTTATLPAPLLTTLQAAASEAGKKPLPRDVLRWLDRTMAIRAVDADAEWSQEDVYLSLPRAGGDAWASIDLATGEVEYERTDRGWISLFNDLHKGRNTGLAWRLFIDALAAAIVIFAGTGLLLLKMHASHRPLTWPAVGFGLVLPLLLAILFVH